MRYFQEESKPEFFLIQLGTLITPTYRFIEIMKVRKMERAENSDLYVTRPSKYGNIFREQKFKRKVPFKYAYMRTQLGKEIAKNNITESHNISQYITTFKKKWRTNGRMKPNNHHRHRPLKQPPRSPPPPTCTFQPI